MVKPSGIGPAFPKVTTTIVISRAAWAWLKRQAADDAERESGKPSASAVLERLIRAESDRST